MKLHYTISLIPTLRLFALAIIVALTTVACGSKNTSPSPNGEADEQSASGVVDLKQIKDKGKLVVLIENSSTSYHVYKGEPMGYEYELLKLFTEHIGVGLDIMLIDDMDNVFDLLNAGEVDLVAANLTVTKERSKYVRFTEPFLYTKQVLVQKVPDNWHELSLEVRTDTMVLSPIELVGKEVHVRKNSSFYSRLKSLSDEIGGEIDIVEVSGDVETEELIRKVAYGEIQYTVADENVAMINKTYYPRIHVSTAISFPQKIAFAVRKSSPQLAEEINNWLLTHGQSLAITHLQNKYFKSSKSHYLRKASDYSSLSGSRISPYDHLFEEYSKIAGWDWRLIAAQAYKESRFEHNAVSWAGAFGVMQLMPTTAEQYGVDSLSSPRHNIRAGVLYLSWLDKHWESIIEDEEERVKFSLASYNVGLGHVIDARNLAAKYDHDPFIWDDNVEKFLKLKSNPKYFNDPVVKHGYCRGAEPVNYVRDILELYGHYSKINQEEI